MSKRRTIYMDDKEWEAANWLAGELRQSERRDVSVSEVIRRLLIAAYQQRSDAPARSGPGSPVPDHE